MKSFLTYGFRQMTAAVMTFSLMAAGGAQGAKPAAKEGEPFKEFVSRKNDRLMVGDRELRFVSINAPNIAILEDEEVKLHLIDPKEQLDVILTIDRLGGLVTRSYVLSVKKKGDKENRVRHVLAPGVFNEEAFVGLDYALFLANKHRIRIIIPFVDNWHWWGGIKEYAEFRGKEAGAFWSDPQIREDFKKTISYLVNRTNIFTGQKYRDDMAILCWETGNELLATDEWTLDIAKYIKSLDPNHLVMDGKFDGASPFMQASETILKSPYIDIVTNHYYEGHGKGHSFKARASKDRALSKGKKPFVVGEFGLSKVDSMKEMLDEVIADGSSGALIWSLRGHHRSGGFYHHKEYEQYFSFHYPGFESGKVYEEIAVFKMLIKAAFEIRGLPLPPLQPPTVPEILEGSNPHAISFRGSVGGEYYKVERSPYYVGPWEVVGGRVMDDQNPFVPFKDAKAETGKKYFYRMSAINQAGSSEYSQIFGPTEVKAVPKNSGL
ncbi:MAG: cellulase family glycosylhydrolase [Oligoflexales bacterium]|nr:cellulase family glycosylhydrolase [Oligoflexales bacterium]